MPLTKPQPSLQSPSQAPLLLSLRRTQAHQQPLSNTASSELKLMSRKSGWRLGDRLQAAVRLGAAARRACVNSCLMLLSWAVSEFLDGCAAYALAMYGIPASLDGRLVDATEATQPDQPDGAGPRRPQLVTVMAPAQAHDDRRRHT